MAMRPLAAVAALAAVTRGLGLCRSLIGARLGVDIDELRTRTGAEHDAAADRLGTLVTGFLTHVGTGSVAR